MLKITNNSDRRYARKFPLGNALIEVHDYRSGMLKVSDIMDAGNAMNEEFGIEAKSYFYRIERNQKFQDYVEYLNSQEGGEALEEIDGELYCSKYLAVEIAQSISMPFKHLVAKVFLDGRIVDKRYESHIAYNALRGSLYGLGKSKRMSNEDAWARAEEWMIYISKAFNAAVKIGSIQDDGIKDDIFEARIDLLKILKKRVQVKKGICQKDVEMILEIACLRIAA